MNKDEKGMIETVKVFALEQIYDDGKPNEVWSIGDNTTNGIIVEFAKGTGDYWYAITDTPSEWQKQQGQEFGWSWIFQLKRIPITKSMSLEVRLEIYETLLDNAIIDREVSLHYNRELLSLCQLLSHLEAERRFGCYFDAIYKDGDVVVKTYPEASYNIEDYPELMALKPKSTKLYRNAFWWTLNPKSETRIKKLQKIVESIRKNK